MGLSIWPRLESDTIRAPGVNGAAASLESPWRAVGLRSIQSDTISHSNIFQSIAFSSISWSFQYMLMSCSTSPIALLYSTGWIDVLSSAAHSDSESIDLSCVEKLYFLKGEKKSAGLWRAANLTAVSSSSAPAGRLDWWMKVSEDHLQKQLGIHLFWKVTPLTHACLTPVTDWCIFLYDSGRECVRFNL